MNKSAYISLKHKQILEHIRQFFPSLKFHSQRYLTQIFTNPQNPPEHFIYICPLCITNFILIERSVGFVWTAEFDFDHFPPESVGGFHKMLVCKACNNEAGSLFDFALKDKLNRMSFDKKVTSSTIFAKSAISNVPGNYSSAFFINDDGILEIDLKPSKKAHTPFVDEWLEKSKTDSNWEAKITIKNPDESKVSKALVKSAYLFCFANWGYDFVYSENGERIRKYLADEFEYPIRVPFNWLGESIRKSQVSHFPIGLCYLQNPVTCKTFVVNMVLINKETDFREIASVLIPNPTKEGWDDLKRIEKIFETEYKNTVDITVAHVTDFIVSNGEYEGYTKSWDKLKSFE